MKTVGHVKAVDGITFDIFRGQTLGLVGESGCGKTTAGRALLRLVRPTGGSMHFDGNNINKLDRHGLRQLRNRMQIIFQDPYGSMNPRMTVQAALSEPMALHGIGSSRRDRVDRAASLLEEVGLLSEHLGRYPHEFSGGQRQRICIARALAVEPEFIVCDESVSALDVSVQAQVLNLLNDLQERRDLTYIFISHDLSVVRNASDRVTVMYLGKVCEVGNADAIYSSPAHPYTRVLLASAPEPASTVDESESAIGDEIPSPIHPPSGCRFRTRCPRATDRCATEEPVLRELVEDHFVACHFPS